MVIGRCGHSVERVRGVHETAFLKAGTQPSGRNSGAPLSTFARLGSPTGRASDKASRRGDLAHAG